MHIYHEHVCDTVLESKGEMHKTYSSAKTDSTLACNENVLLSILLPLAEDVVCIIHMDSFHLTAFKPTGINGYTCGESHSSAMTPLLEKDKACVRLACNLTHT